MNASWNASRTACECSGAARLRSFFTTMTKLRRRRRRRYDNGHACRAIVAASECVLGHVDYDDSALPFRLHISMGLGQLRQLICSIDHRFQLRGIDQILE